MVARPRKRRRVCGMPAFKSFGPLDVRDVEEVTLTVEEYEVIRLIDLEKLDQHACAERMGVGRSTIQRMYEEAREKIADCLVNGKLLRIEGGDYVVCSPDKGYCSPCYRRRNRAGRGWE